MSHEDQRISVITIFLNAERFIGEAIESVLAQSHSPLELILVDDGSSDSSTAISRRYAARYPDQVRYVEHPNHENRGMSASRNLGLRTAQGALVAFIDADDVWSPNKLAEQAAIMLAHPDLAMVCGAVRYWRSWMGEEDAIVPTGHVQNRVVEPPEASLALYPLGTAAAPCPSDLLLRRSVVCGLGGFEEHFTGALQMYEDQAFLAKLYLSSAVYFADRVWLDYRQHADSCVAEVTRDGRYHEVRRYFLTWFDSYVRDRPGVDPRLSKALEKALYPYHHPLLHRAETQAKLAPRRVGRLWKAVTSRLPAG